MTDWPVQKTCSLRVYSVCTALAVGLSTTAVQAGAWQEFQTRCLLPMENVLAPNMTGYDLRDDLKQIEYGDNPAVSHVTFYASRGDEALVFVSSDPAVCVYNSWKTDATGEVGYALDWLEEAKASGRYNEVGPTIPGIAIIESHLWREPRLTVWVQTDDGPHVQFVVEETDLES